ncbi:HAD-IIB family hydrolase [Humidisolicoccus flavus]|uniref:HAD-IIB family hydrolase n=1 Tax=Humidisolicoccus flavus TaxID=3111414 RepID=UPI00324A95BB
MSERPEVRRALAEDKLFIALDIDGTILHEDGSVSQAVIDAVRAVEAEGHIVMLATGRSEAMTTSVAEQFDINPAYLISANGAIVLERAGAGWNRVHVDTFNPEQVLRTIASELPEGRFMVEDPEGFRRYTRGMIDWNLNDAIEVPFERLWEVPATRVVVMSPDHELDDFLKIVESMGLKKVSYAIGFSSWLDIAPEGINKATGLARVVEWLGVPRDRVVVMGDGRNDIDMFTWAIDGGGRAIAMGQAPEEVRSAANGSTGTVDEDGAAQFLRSLLAE